MITSLSFTAVGFLTGGGASVVGCGAKMARVDIGLPFIPLAAKRVCELMGHSSFKKLLAAGAKQPHLFLAVFCNGGSPWTSIASAYVEPLEYCAVRD